MDNEFYLLTVFQNIDEPNTNILSDYIEFEGFSGVFNHHLYKIAQELILKEDLFKIIVPYDILLLNLRKLKIDNLQNNISDKNKDMLALFDFIKEHYNYVSITEYKSNYLTI
jgi:hypothetical protein